MATPYSILSGGGSMLLAETCRPAYLHEMLRPLAAAARLTLPRRCHPPRVNVSARRQFSRRQYSSACTRAAGLPVRASAVPVTLSTRQYSAAAAATQPTTPWSPPPETEVYKRPVLILGAGVLGRRLAVMWAWTTRPVILCDTSQDALASGIEYISDNLAEYCAEEETHPGHVAATTDLTSACAAGPAPWMVIDALPEDLAIKRVVLGEAESLVPRDCILASNSSSFRTAEMLAGGDSAGGAGVRDATRLLNTHYYIPPRNRIVELMSSGATADAVFPFVAAQMASVGLRPLVLPSHVQSTGFVFNRIWAAIQRETLAVLAEGVVRDPADVDELFRDFFQAERGPCEKMDEVGLDTVARVQRQYLRERPELGSGPQLEWLEREYVAKRKLGEKSGGGLYTADQRAWIKEKREAEGREVGEESQGA